MKINFIQNTFILNNFVHATVFTILNILILTCYLFFESLHVMTLLPRQCYFTHLLHCLKSCRSNLPQEYAVEICRGHVP